MCIFTQSDTRKCEVPDLQEVGSRRESVPRRRCRDAIRSYTKGARATRMRQLSSRDTHTRDTRWSLSSACFVTRCKATRSEAEQPAEPYVAYAPLVRRDVGARERHDKSSHIVDPILPAARILTFASLLSIYPDMLGVCNRGDQQVRSLERDAAVSQEALAVSPAVWRNRRTVEHREKGRSEGWRRTKWFRS